MSIENQTNHGRVEKIVELLGLLDKSARSNKASTQELMQLLAPVITRIEEMAGTEPGTAQEAPPDVSAEPDEAEPETPIRGALRVSSWESIDAFVHGLHGRDLTTAMHKLCVRIDEEIFEQ